MKVLPHLLHLGAFIAGSGAAGPEVNRLITNMNQAWGYLQHFWTSKVGYSPRRLVFMGTVLGNAMSGSEAIKLTTSQAMKNDANICNKQTQVHAEGKGGVDRP